MSVCLLVGQLASQLDRGTLKRVCCGREWDASGCSGAVDDVCGLGISMVCNATRHDTVSKRVKSHQSNK